MQNELQPIYRIIISSASQAVWFTFLHYIQSYGKCIFSICGSCSCHSCQCGGIIVFVIVEKFVLKFSLHLATPSFLANLPQTLSFQAFRRTFCVWKVLEPHTAHCFFVFIMGSGKSGFPWCLWCLYFPG